MMVGLTGVVEDRFNGGGAFLFNLFVDEGIDNDSIGAVNPVGVCLDAIS